MRDINDILFFRNDISPFLVHLCRDLPDRDRSARQSLESIIEDRRLNSLDDRISDARFGMNTMGMSNEDKLRYFGAVCFTETPINEIHCLLEIAYRGVELEPYGLVFLKERLEEKGVSPVIYINNQTQDKERVFSALCSLIDTNPEAAADLLPFISVFGRKLISPGAQVRLDGIIDFRWEREWRFPHARGALQFDDQDVFIGLCPHGEIDNFEERMPGIGFVDPMRNMKWYATKLIDARQRLNLKYSVV